jgi:hypothetical protein
MVVVPLSVRRVVEAWRAAGSPSQAGIVWPLERWIDSFAAEATAFGVLPDRLTRPVVRGACRQAGESPAEARRAFPGGDGVGLRPSGIRPVPGPAPARRGTQCGSRTPGSSPHAAGGRARRGVCAGR